MEKQVATIEQQLFADLHGDQDKLIIEVISKGNVIDHTKNARMNTLASMMFYGSKSVIEHQSQEYNAARAKNVMERVRYYKQNYPLQKFISEEQVKDICEKYKLFLCNARYFIAEIPEKNQKEIVDFRVIRKDVREIWDGSLSFSGGGFIGTSCKPTPPNENERILGKGLHVIAPEDNFHSSAGFEKIGHKLIDNDPIVLQPVEHGYLIISSWGLEAGDPTIVNPINN